MTKLSVGFVVFAALLAGGCAAAPSEEQASHQDALESAPLRFSGEYVPDGVVEPLARMTIDVVDTRMSDAEERLAAARAAGATCQLVISNTYRCKNIRPASEVPASSLEKMAARHASAVVKFGELVSTSLVSEAQSLTEWQIIQSGSSPEGTFDRFRYLKLGGDMVKIVLPGASEVSDYELIVRDADTLRRWDRVVVNENRWRWHEDMGTVVLSRRQ